MTGLLSAPPPHPHDATEEAAARHASAAARAIGLIVPHPLGALGLRAPVVIELVERRSAAAAASAKRGRLARFPTDPVAALGLLRGRPPAVAPLLPGAILFAIDVAVVTRVDVAAAGSRDRAAPAWPAR